MVQLSHRKPSPSGNRVPVPSFFRGRLADSARGSSYGRRYTYYDAGFHIGTYHVETFELDEDVILNVTERDEETKPTATLRRVLANEDHPNGPMVQWIPPKRRRDFLRGIVDGVRGESRYAAD